MLDRWSVYGLLLILSCEVFFASYVGPQLATLGVAIPVLVAAYRVIVVRTFVSDPYRTRVAEALTRAAVSRPRHAILFGLFLLAFFGSFVRAVQLGTFDLVVGAYHGLVWASVLAILFAGALEAETEDGQDSLLRYLVIAALVYAAANVGLYFMGVTNQSLSGQYVAVPEPAMILQLMGINVTRAPMPISSGINDGGEQVACGLAVSYALWRSARSNPRLRRLAIAVGLCSGLCVLITDSRGPILAALVASGVAAAPRPLKRRTKWLALGIPALPFLLMLAVARLVNEPWIQHLTRNGGTDFLSNRPLVWGSILGFLSSFNPAHIIGYGALGQVGSGVSERYAALFAADVASPIYAGAHNSSLQAILDTGYIGFALQLLLYWEMFRWYGERSSRGGPQSRWPTVGLAALAFLLVAGGTEQTLTISVPVTLTFFLALNVNALVSPDHDIGERDVPLSTVTE